MNLEPAFPIADRKTLNQYAAQYGLRRRLFESDLKLRSRILITLLGGHGPEPDPNEEAAQSARLLILIYAALGFALILLN